MSFLSSATIKTRRSWPSWTSRARLELWIYQKILFSDSLALMLCPAISPRMLLTWPWNMKKISTTLKSRAGRLESQKQSLPRKKWKQSRSQNPLATTPSKLRTKTQPGRKTASRLHRKMLSKPQKNTGTELTSILKQWSVSKHRQPFFRTVFTNSLQASTEY